MFRFRSPEPVVLITGAGQGIGQELAIAFAERGARVAVNDLEQDRVSTTVDLISAMGGVALDCPGDVSRQDSVDEMYDRILDTLGNVSVLINNAAYYEFTPSLDQTEISFTRTIDVDLTSIWRMVRGAVGHMESAGGGSVVNLASANGFFTIPQNTAYAGAKAGVVGLTRGLALELGPRGIRINSICPGFCLTPAVDRYLTALSPQRRAVEMGLFYDRIPLGRLTTPREAANLCLFLASENASYIHGTHFAGDGGMWALNKMHSYNP